MLVIRTAEEMARALASPLGTTLYDRLTSHRDNLLSYPDFAFEELGLFLIVQPGDTLEAISGPIPARLIEGSAFILEAETVDLHGNLLELLFILSEDGFGLVLFVPLRPDIDPRLLSACEAFAPNLKLSADR